MCASWILGSWLLEYVYVILSSVPFMFDMPDITTSILSPTPGPSVDPGVGMGGTKTPYLSHRFRSGHFLPSTPFVEYFHSHGLVLTPVSILTGMVVDK